jgi:hypothetical protein
MTHEERRCLINGAAGIYVPQRFVESFDTTQWGISADDIAYLLEGPDNEHHWDVWDRVISSASFTDVDGVTWVLDQDSDLFAVDVRAYDEEES